MKVTEKSYRFESTNGMDEISGRAHFPEGKPRGMIQILHDQGEHMGRYRLLMKELASAGYLVFGNYHMGHGEAAREAERLGRFSGENNVLHMVDDVKKMFAQVLADCSVLTGETEKKSDSSKTPMLRCLVGVGIGAAMAKAYVLRNRDCNALILCGDRGFVSGVNMEERECERLIRKQGGTQTAAPLWEKRQQKYNRYIEYPEADSWRTTSRQEVGRFQKDPLCGITYDLYSYRTLLQLERLLTLREWTGSYSEYLPLYVMAGVKDPVSNYTRELDRMLERLRYSDAKNVFYKYYKNSRHDLLFDVEASQVLQDIKRFLDMIQKQWRQQ